NGLSATKAGPLLRNSITVREAGDEDEQAPGFNHALINWAGDKNTYFTRSRPYKSNGDVVRRHAFHYRYDTAAALKLLNALYTLVRVRLNLFTATTKATGWRSNKHGQKTRINDNRGPRTNASSIPES
ncbi:hypothetical protein ABIB27_001481, partial [Arthrobacter sp. UYEF21]